jgi:hypothetical protein
MIPADIDPSLCTGEPTLDSLEDGFSPPSQQQQQQGSVTESQPDAGPLLTTKSSF